MHAIINLEYVLIPTLYFITTLLHTPALQVFTKLLSLFSRLERNLYKRPELLYEL